MAHAVENNIRRLRELRGERLTDLAEKLGVDHSTISKWERRHRECPDHFKVALARHFGWPVHAVFMFGEDESPVSLSLRLLADRLAELEEQLQEQGA